MLVNAEDPAAFAQALERLIRDPARRRVLGEAGRQRVRAQFALEANLDRLAARFALAGSRENRVLRSA